MDNLMKLLEEFRAELGIEIEHLKKQIKELPHEYLDSTGKVIDQPKVHLRDKKHTVSFPALFKNGKFFNDKSQGEFEFDYEFANRNYYIAQTGDRIACYRNDCLFNKYQGCTIKPMLTIGANWKVICGSMIDIK